jgi:hypothetical protein
MLSQTVRAVTLFVVLAAILFLNGKSRAQDDKEETIKWRENYAEARSESERKNMPLLILFTRPSSIFCDKLVTTTFRDRRVVAAVNGKVIPLKIDSSEHHLLKSSLDICIYPTTVLAEPDGAYESLVGYQEADVLVGKIARIVAITENNKNARDAGLKVKPPAGSAESRR